MSWTSNVHSEQFAYQSVNRRTVAGIQNKVIEKGKRNVASQVFHSKNDKDAIAAWRQDLIRILQIFNVRSIDSILQSLIYPFQTELSINTHMIVVDIHRNVLAIQAGSDGQNASVSMASPPANNGTLIVSQTQARSALVNTIDSSCTYIRAVSLRENLLRHLPELVSDGPSLPKRSLVSRKASNPSLSSVQVGLEKLQLLSLFSTTTRLRTGLATTVDSSVAISSRRRVLIFSHGSPTSSVQASRIPMT